MFDPHHEVVIRHFGSAEPISTTFAELGRPGWLRGAGWAPMSWHTPARFARPGVPTKPRTAPSGLLHRLHRAWRILKGG